jgi:hypothetical protein
MPSTFKLTIKMRSRTWQRSAVSSRAWRRAWRRRLCSSTRAGPSPADVETGCRREQLLVLQAPDRDQTGGRFWPKAVDLRRPSLCQLSKPEVVPVVRKRATRRFLRVRNSRHRASIFGQTCTTRRRTGGTSTAISIIPSGSIHMPSNGRKEKIPPTMHSNPSGKRTSIPAGLISHDITRAKRLGSLACSRLSKRLNFFCSRCLNNASSLKG